MRKSAFPKELSPTKLKAAMIVAARAGGKILKRNFGRNFKVSEKKNAGLVTEIDLASEKAILKILRKARPDFAVLAEESSPKKGESPGRWIIDPLDGTTNYVHGFPMFCVAIAAEWEGEIVGGVIYHPLFEETYVALRGKGAHLNGRKLKVSQTKKVTDALLTTGFAYQEEDELRSEIRKFGRISHRARAVRRPGSAALDLAYVARGVFDGFWERNLSPWDVAAGALLVSEAGGSVTRYSGSRFEVHGDEILASNSRLHTDLVQILARP